MIKLENKNMMIPNLHWSRQQRSRNGAEATVRDLCFFVLRALTEGKNIYQKSEIAYQI